MRFCSGVACYAVNHGSPQFPIVIPGDAGAC